MSNLSTPLSNISDENLFILCKEYGEKARMWRQKFIGLLPEVNRRRLYEKKGFESIFMFAKILAGLSEEQVRLALNLEKRLDDKPVLQKMLVTGEVSINKLARVVSIATIENEEELAVKIKLLSQKALETLVRDEKLAQQETTTTATLPKNQNSSQEQLFDDKSLRAQTKINFTLDEDIIQDLNELHEKGININNLLRTMLQQRHEQIVQAKEEISTTAKPTTSRYIPAKVKKVLKEEYGDKCSIQNCHKKAREKHHAQRFSLSQIHDSKYIAPLCKEHHQIAHSADFSYHQIRKAYVGH